MTVFKSLREVCKSSLSLSVCERLSSTFVTASSPGFLPLMTRLTGKVYRVLTQAQIITPAVPFLPLTMWSFSMIYALVDLKKKTELRNIYPVTAFLMSGCLPCLALNVCLCVYIMCVFFFVFFLSFNCSCVCVNIKLRSESDILFLYLETFQFCCCVKIVLQYKQKQAFRSFHCPWTWGGKKSD